GGVNTGHDAYVAHLTGARAVCVGSALIKEGAGALERIDRELDALLAQYGKRTVVEIVGQASFELPLRALRRVIFDPGEGSFSARWRRFGKRKGKYLRGGFRTWAGGPPMNLPITARRS